MKHRGKPGTHTAFPLDELEEGVQGEGSLGFSDCPALDKVAENGWMAHFPQQNNSLPKCKIKPQRK